MTTTTTTEATYRVIKLTDALRDAFKATRTEKGLTNQAMLELAITESLPALVDALSQLGFGRTVGKTRPARFPFSDGLLGFLKESSEKVGIPAQQLLLLCIAQQCPEVADQAPKATKPIKKASKPDLTKKAGAMPKPQAKKSAKKSTKRAAQK